MPEPGHDENPPAPTVKRLQRNVRYDALAAVIAALVGLLALLVASCPAVPDSKQLID